MDVELAPGMAGARHAAAVRLGPGLPWLAASHPSAATAPEEVLDPAHVEMVLVTAHGALAALDASQAQHTDLPAADFRAHRMT